MSKYRTLNFGLEQDADLLHRIKLLVAVRLRKLAKTGYPMTHRIGGRDLWIDVDSLTNAVIIEGIVPNAAEIKGFSAPIDKRSPTRAHPVQLPYGWKTIANRAKTGTPGIPIRWTTEYWGGRTIQKNLGIFGVKHGGAVRAYGLDSDGALPAYYYVAVPEWLIDEQMDEVNRIVDEAIRDVMDAAIGAA